ncbi:hypothetical protein HNQ59_000920 [Chitinivorax tropicus]|uniref:DUF1090 domain-containing protein n=1 Tax=Chitinivorax tropicus TaxID=714531 RepID=A0A840MQZ3_9PROT|nr:hypothetical protein [Chitinivorax tropicus]MBB5017651.1 hypothetical protein [Chitinivorax tropicus]
MKKQTLLPALLMLLVAPQTWAESAPTEYDPAKHTEKMRVYCADLDKQLGLMAKREKLGLRATEKERFLQKRGELEAKREKHCAQFKAQ